MYEPARRYCGRVIDPIFGACRAKHVRTVSDRIYGCAHGGTALTRVTIIRFLLTERSCVYVDDLNDRVAATFAFGIATVAIPIFNGDDLAGFTLYGVHRDGTRLDPDEAAVLEALARALVGSGMQPSVS